MMIGMKEQFLSIINIHYIIIKIIRKMIIVNNDDNK